MIKYTRSITYFTCCLLMWQHISAAPTESLTSPLDVSVNVAQTDYNAGEPLWVDVTLRNKSSQTVHFLTWNTPFEGYFNADMFKIDGVQSAYLGKLVKRGAPSSKDIRTLAPGAELHATVDLTQGYTFKHDGIATIRLMTNITQLDTLTNSVNAKMNRGYGFLLKRRLLKSNPVSLILHDTQLIAKQWQLTKSDSIQGSTVHCSSSQNASISEAHPAAVAMVADAASALSETVENDRPAAMRYRTWFGAYDSQRYNKVMTHFNNIAANISKVTVDCTCNAVADPATTFAYALPSQPYIIHACGLFWKAPVVGTDSRGGTLVHEMTHFNIIAGTDDHAYGQVGAMNLADTDPDMAIDNADSHEYFAENMPKLGM